MICEIQLLAPELEIHQNYYLQFHFERQTRK